jgi:hypothetical protein
MKLKKRFASIVILTIVSLSGHSQTAAIFHSSDTAIQNAFNWAKDMALHYRGDANDPVGPWYEAALPSRDAFCIRDVSHQCIGAEILGMNNENKNMLTKFTSNISESKDWCTYWEIDKWNKPAPADYKNDQAFWYNLNANFELIYACERLYRWTGDSSYINSLSNIEFFEKSLNEYITRWTLEADSLFTRLPIPNLPANYDKTDNYTRSKGLPSYIENVDGLKIGVDLVAAIYRGLMSYSNILKIKGDAKRSEHYAQEANKYLQQLESKWWNSERNNFYTHYMEDGKFFTGEGAMFLLWYDVIKDHAKTKSIIDEVTSSDMNVETMSYLPYLFYKNGYDSVARKYILHLSNPSTKRREYPEVSYGVIEGIVQGVMGIEPDAFSNTINTCYKDESDNDARLDSLSILGSVVSVEHNAKTKSTFTNNGNKTINWKASFRNSHKVIYINNKAIKAKREFDASGKLLSYVIIPVVSGQTVSARVK